MVNRDTLLLACGTSESRAVLCTIFENSFNLLEASNIRQTKLLLGQNHGCIAAVIFDVVNFEDSSLDDLGQITKNKAFSDIPILVITSCSSASTHEHLFDLGVSDIITAPYSPTILRHRILSLTDLSIHKLHLNELVQEQSNILRCSNDAMVDALCSIIEHRNAESGQHVLRIRRFTKILLTEVARSCPEYNLDEETIQMISSASSLHDIGKISISDSILAKPDALTVEEQMQMQTHTIAGCCILESLAGCTSQEYLRYAMNICRYHHERWDGRGYPEGLSGEDIPICAQVVGLADVYDALTNKRVYKEAFSCEQSANMILNGECGVFSPKLLECFKQITHQFAELAQEYIDSCDLKADSSLSPLPPPSPPSGTDSLHLIQAKYHAILHYMDATVLELDLEKSTYHLLYNPDPNLILLNSATSFDELFQTILQNMITEEDSALFKDICYNKIPLFLQANLRRQLHYLHIKNSTNSDPILYRITLLRIDPHLSSHKGITVICEQISTENSIFTPKLNKNNLHLDTLSSLTNSLYSIRNDRFLTLHRCGQNLLPLLGYTTETLAQTHQNRMIELVHPDDRQPLLKSIADQLSFGLDLVNEFRIQHKDGHYIWVLGKGRLYVAPDGKEYIYSLLIDISVSKIAEEVLQQTLQRQAVILSQTENVIFECDMAGKEAFFSENWEKIFGYSPFTHNIMEHITTDSHHFHPDDVSKVLAAFNALQNGSDYQEVETRIAKADGRYLWCQGRITVQYDSSGNPEKMVGVIVNIDEKKRAAQALQSRAERDGLTNLLNKDTGESHIEDYLHTANRNTTSALLIIDLDNFKQVNDQYGHMFGDIILSRAAKEIQSLFRSNDIIARIGGDEFIVFMKNIPSLNLVRKRVSTLISTFNTTLHAQVPEANLGCSVGVAIFPTHGSSYEDLFLRADQALYQIKAQGKHDYNFYDGSGSVIRNHREHAIATTPIDSDSRRIFTANNLMQYTFQQLYESNNLEDAITNLLTLIGQRMNVSRVYIFENSSDNTHCSNTFEWCNVGITPEIQNLQNLSYSVHLIGYEKNFNDQGIFYCDDISKLPSEQYDVLAPQGIKSMLQCSIRDNGMFRGFVGFDDCSVNRLWTQDQINSLAFFSEILSTFLLKKRAQDETARRAENLSSVLENQQAWIYVIDPQTHQIIFLNEKTKSIAPDAAVGQQCFKCLMGLDEQCADCPTRNMEHGNNERPIYNANLHLSVLSAATSIQWDGKDAYLITCRENNPNR